MGEMKLRMGEIAELFQRYHPEFTLDEAAAYIIYHHTTDYWLRYKRKIENFHNLPYKRSMSIFNASKEEAKNLAIKIGEKFHYNNDYLESNIIVFYSAHGGFNVVQIFIFQESETFPDILIPGGD